MERRHCLKLECVHLEYHGTDCICKGTGEAPEAHPCPGGLENEIVGERCCTNCGATFESVRADDALCKKCLLEFKDRLYRDLMNCRAQLYLMVENSSTEVDER